MCTMFTDTFIVSVYPGLTAEKNAIEYFPTLLQSTFIIVTDGQVLWVDH